MNVTIIGAGNGGQAIAAHYAILGHRVSLYARNLQKISIIAETKTIRLTEAINGIGSLQNVTDNLQMALSDAELVMIVTTADAHKNIAKQLAPYLKDNQVIVLNPGRTLGVIEFSNTLYQYTDKQLFIAEAQSLIYACRAETPGNVRIIGIKDKVLLAAYPATDTPYVCELLNSVFDCFVPAVNVLLTGLENIGAIFHPAVILFNAAAIERGNLFYFYNDMTPAVASFLEKLDQERLSIGKAFGINLRPVSDWVSYAYSGIVGDTLCEKMQNNPAYYKILAPTKLNSRLLTEDIPTGILPMIELAKIVNLPTPLMESVLNIAESLLGINFREEGRTLQNILGNVNQGDIKKILLT